MSGWEGAELSPSTCPLPNFWPDLPPMGERREPNAGGQHAGKGGGAEALARYKMYEYRAVRACLRSLPERSRAAPLDGERTEACRPVRFEPSGLAWVPLAWPGPKPTWERRAGRHATPGRSGTTEPLCRLAIGSSCYHSATAGVRRVGVGRSSWDDQHAGRTHVEGAPTAGTSLENMLTVLRSSKLHQLVYRVPSELGFRRLMWVLGVAAELVTGADFRRWR